MRISVITGGPIDDFASYIVRGSDLVYACDSGYEFALRNDIKVDRLVGDFDSLDPELLALAKHRNVPIEQYPVEKDQSDTELVLDIIAREYPDATVDLICPASGRLDHVLANLDCLLKMKKAGVSITASDGITDIIPMTGKDSINVEGINTENDIAISIMPRTECTGVTTKGLYYKMEDQTIRPGGSLTLSNKLIEGCDSFSVSSSSGDILVIITPAV